VNPQLRTIQRLLIVMLAGALSITALITGMAPQVWGILNAHSQIPVQLPGFAGLSQRSVLFDVAGEQIGVFQKENTQKTPVDSVPVDVIASILAVEDAVFYSHKGVNLRAVVRATLANTQGSTRQGASTITQQVVKNDFLAGLDRDGRYKVLQSRYAVMLEKQVPKKLILERYLNTVFFGNNAYGLQAAAEVYFGAPVSALTVTQGAFLAGLIQAPSSYDPIRRPDASRTRYKIVLARLVDVGLITNDVATATCAGWEKPKVRTLVDAECVIPEQVETVPQQDVNRSYFTEEVKDYLLNRSTVLGATYQDRYNKLFRGGLKIYTTLNKKDQIAAEAAAAEQLPENKPGIQAAVVSIDNATGGVRAMVGGTGFVPVGNEINLALRRRQTGSSVKMFILAAALQAGLLPDDLIDGTLPCTLPNPSKPEEPFYVSKGVSHEVAPLRIMTALSINCAYAKLSQVVGLERVVSLMYKMLDSEFTNPETYQIQPYASLATGANELSPLDMATGAQTIANGGVHLRPYLIDKIEDANGVLFQHEQLCVAPLDVEPCRVLSNEVALRTVDTMKGVIQFGTARRTALEPAAPIGDKPRPAAGKTGTQDDNTNAWFVGYTKQLTTAVWVGDPKAYTPMVNIPEFVKQDGIARVQGSMYPARIWKQYMDVAHEGLPSLDWDVAPTPVATETRPDPNPMRIYLPGTECLAEVVSGTIPSTTTTTSIKPGRTTTTTTTIPIDLSNPLNTVVVRVVDPGTTIAPTDTNPFSPVNTVAIGGYWVYECAQPFSPAIQTVP
jgi:penicillin-binding protein 1A